jgi:hypothetical protein
MQQNNLDKTDTGFITRSNVVLEEKVVHPDASYLFLLVCGAHNRPLSSHALNSHASNNRESYHLQAKGILNEFVAMLNKGVTDPQLKWSLGHIHFVEAKEERPKGENWVWLQLPSVDT